MREQHTLRPAGGAGGVQDVRGRVRSDRDGRRGRCHRLGRGLRVEHHAAGGSTALAIFPCSASARTVTIPALARIRTEPLGQGRTVQHGRDLARPQHAYERRELRDALGRQHRHRLRARPAGVEQRAGHARGHRVEGGVGDGRRARAEHGPVAVAAHHVGEARGQGLVERLGGDRLVRRGGSERQRRAGLRAHALGRGQPSHSHTPRPITHSRSAPVSHGRCSVNSVMHS